MRQTHTHTHITLHYIPAHVQSGSGAALLHTCSRLQVSKEGQTFRKRRKSVWPPQIFTQEQMYCRNITHQSRSVIRWIFFSLLLRESSTPLSPSTPPPASPGLLKCILARDPRLWQPERYTCAQNPARHIKWLPDRLLLLKCRQRYASAGRAWGPSERARACVAVSERVCKVFAGCKNSHRRHQRRRRKKNI